MANSKLFLTDNNFSQSSTSYAKNYCQFSIGDAFAIELFAMAHQAKASRRTQVTIGAAPMALVNRNIVIGSPYGLPF